MSYAVDWTDDALAALADVWTQALDRQAVTVAQVAIDRLLAADPLGNSTPVSEGLHAIEVHPLRVLFELAEEEQVVTVVYARALP